MRRSVQFVVTNDSGYNYFWLHKRNMNKSLLGFRMASSLQDEAAGVLDVANISYVKKPKKFLITVDRQMVEANQEVFKSIAALVKKTWESDT